MNGSLRDYEGDVFYEAWRRGLNPDRAVECAYDCFHEGRTPTECVNEREAEVERMREEQARIEEEVAPSGEKGAER